MKMNNHIENYPKPSYRQIEWYKREKTAFFHFGMNTFTGNAWGDGNDPAELFNPSDLDCKQWVSTVKQAGFTCAILTAKHHDGFCLWPSKYTDYSVKSSPYKNGCGDVVKEFTDACAQYGIKAGLYLSPWDRHEHTYGTDAYNDYYVNQLTELLTNYGKIYECWWDGAGSLEADYDWGRWAYTVRNLQPDCIIFGSLGAAHFAETRWVGNESGITQDNCWATLKKKTLLDEVADEMNIGCPDGDIFVPAEVDTSIRPGWFYLQEQDESVKTSSELFRYWFNSIGSNAGMLLNVPPMPNGKLNNLDIDSLLRANALEKQTFAVNLAWGANVSGKFADKILNDDEEYYECDSLNKTITVQLKENTVFDCISISEKIDFGHRVLNFEIEALVKGEWKSLLKAECIGYKRAFYFEPIKARKIRIKLIGRDKPLIRHFGIYKLPDGCFDEEIKIKNNVDLSKTKIARLHINDTEIEVDFGGIYPFNTVKFNGLGIEKYEVQAFDGTKYYTICNGTRPSDKQIVSFSTVIGSYKMRIIANSGMFKNPDISIVEL